MQNNNRTFMLNVQNSGNIIGSIIKYATTLPDMLMGLILTVQITVY